MGSKYVYVVTPLDLDGTSKQGIMSVFEDPRHIPDSIRLSFGGVKGTNLEPIVPSFISVLGPTIIKNKLGHSVLRITPTPVLTDVEHL